MQLEAGIKGMKRERGKKLLSVWLKFYCRGDCSIGLWRNLYINLMTFDSIQLNIQLKFHMRSASLVRGMKMSISTLINCDLCRQSFTFDVCHIVITDAIKRPINLRVVRWNRQHINSMYRFDSSFCCFPSSFCVAKSKCLCVCFTSPQLRSNSLYVFPKFRFYFELSITYFDSQTYLPKKHPLEPQHSKGFKQRT